MTIDHRRSFLQKMGIAVPAVVAAGAEYGGIKPAAPGTMTAEEVFTTYVSEALFHLQGQTLPSVQDIKVIEAQGAALALVLTQLQKQGAS